MSFQKYQKEIEIVLITSFNRCSQSFVQDCKHWNCKEVLRCFISTVHKTAISSTFRRPQDSRSSCIWDQNSYRIDVRTKSLTVMRRWDADLARQNPKSKDYVTMSFSWCLVPVAGLKCQDFSNPLLDMWNVVKLQVPNTSVDSRSIWSVYLYIYTLW